MAGKEVSLTPSLGQERIHAIDALRGVAVLGILILNIRTFALPGLAYFNPTVAGVESSVDAWVFWGVQLLGDQKFMSIFSMLFGAGIILMADRILAKGGSPGGLHYKRMAWLLVIGLIHAYLVWYGDILVSYALCGMLVYPLRRLPPVVQAVLGTGLLCFGALIWAGLGWSMQFMDSADFVTLKAKLVFPTAEMLEDEAAIKLGSWLDQMPNRASEAVAVQTFVFLFYSVWRVSGLMLLGMALFRWGIFSAKRSTGLYCSMIVIGGVAGVALSNWTLELNEAAQWGSMDILFLYSMPAYLGGVLTSLAWVGLIMALCRGGIGWLGRLFARAGRMALTNYIAQSLLCSVLFYGWGLGLYGLLGYSEQWFVIVSIWVLELIWSTWWLTRFNYGPLEWVWRSLVLWSRQSICKEAL